VCSFIETVDGLLFLLVVLVVVVLVVLVWPRTARGRLGVSEDKTEYPIQHFRISTLLFGPQFFDLIEYKPLAFFQTIRAPPNLPHHFLEKLFVIYRALFQSGYAVF
jgi:hypothetical protein